MADNGYGSSTLRLIKMKIRASGCGSMPLEISSGVRQGCDRSPTLFKCIIDLILGQVLQGYPGVQIGANVHVSDLAYTDGVVILSSSYWKVHDLLEAVNRHAIAADMRSKASKMKVASVLIHGCT